MTFKFNIFAKYKSFITALSATIILVLFAYTAYLTIYKLASGTSIQLALVPAVMNECPKCAINIYSDNTASITVDNQGKPTTISGFKLVDFQENQSTATVTFRLTTNHNKPDLVFFGAKLKTMNNQQANELGYKNSHNGLGYVIVASQSDLNGISGSIPIQWVANKTPD